MGDRDAGHQTLFPFGAWTLDDDSRLLRHSGGATRALGGKARDLLRVLVERPGHVVSYASILGRVWEEDLPERELELRKAKNKVHAAVRRLNALLGDPTVSVKPSAGGAYDDAGYRLVVKGGGEHLSPTVATSAPGVSEENRRPSFDIGNLLSLPAADEGGRSSRFAFYARRTPLFGRDEELSKLTTFLAAPAPFSWLLVTGGGGSGKSRLALELCLESGPGWTAGFLDRAGAALAADEVARGWNPTKPTLVIIDHVALCAEGTRAVLVRLAIRARQGSLGRKVRLVIVERTRSENWWRVFWPPGEEQHVMLAAAFDLGSQPVPFELELQALRGEPQAKMLGGFLDSLGVARGRQAEMISTVMESTSDQSTVVGLFMADALANGATSREWNKREYAEDVLERERSIWRERGLSFREEIVIAAISARRGASDDELETMLSFLADEVRPLGDWLHLIALLESVLGRSRDGKPRALEPDLLAEIHFTAVNDTSLNRYPSRLSSVVVRSQLSAILSGDLTPVQTFFQMLIEDFDFAPRLAAIGDSLEASSRENDVFGRFVAVATSALATGGTREGYVASQSMLNRLESATRSTSAGEDGAYWLSYGTLQLLIACTSPIPLYPGSTRRLFRCLLEIARQRQEDVHILRLVGDALSVICTTGYQVRSFEGAWIYYRLYRLIARRFEPGSETRRVWFYTVGESLVMLAHTVFVYAGSKDLMRRVSPAMEDLMAQFEAGVSTEPATDAWQSWQCYVHARVQIFARRVRATTQMPALRRSMRSLAGLIRRLGKDTVIRNVTGPDGTADSELLKVIGSAAKSPQSPP